MKIDYIETNGNEPTKKKPVLKIKVQDGRKVENKKAIKRYKDIKKGHKNDIKRIKTQIRNLKNSIKRHKLIIRQEKISLKLKIQK